MKPLPSCPSRFSDGNEAIFEDQFRRVAGAQAKLVFFLAGAKSLRIFFHDERGEPVRVSGAVRHGKHDQHVGVVAVGDKSLGAVQHPSALRLGGGHARAARVRARRRLGQSPGADKFPGRQLGDVLLFLTLVSGYEDVIRAQRSVRRDDDADGPVNARQLFDHGDVLDVAHPRAAVFRRERSCPASPACRVP